MSLKILLLSPPVFDYYYTPARMEPLGLYYIKKSLDELQGVHTEIYDSLYSGKKKDVKRPEEFSYLDEIYREDYSVFSLFYKYFRFGDSFDKIIKFIKKNSFNLVGISSLFSAYHPEVENLLLRIKNETGAKTVIGGWAVTAEADHICSTTNADFIITRNPEQSIKHLAEILISGHIPSPGNKIMNFIQPCNFPDEKFTIEEHPLRDKAYYFKGKRIAKMVLSRGCVNRCGFCSVHSRYSFKLRSAESIKREIDYLYNEGVRLIDFEDDNLFCGEKFSRELLSLLKKYSKIGMSFTAMNGITASNLAPFTEEALESGFIEFNLSMATGRKEVLSGISRPDSSSPVKYISEINSGRADIIAFLIAGLPGTNCNDLINDIIYLAELPLKIGFSPLYILPGVGFFRDMDLPESRRLLRGSALYRFGDEFSRTDIASYWKLVRLVNALKVSNDPESLEEDIFYFKKSVSERNWYHKLKSGQWQKGFRFSCRFPDKINVTALNGRQIQLILK